MAAQGVGYWPFGPTVSTLALQMDAPRKTARDKITEFIARFIVCS
jgi:hypothetical protein